MSVESLAIVLHHSEQTGTAKVVMLGIANHDGDGGAWPSVATLARYARVDPRTVRRAIRACVEAGELAVDVNAGGNASTPPDRRPNRYRILLSCPDSCDRTTAHRGDADVRPRGDADVRAGGTPTSAEPSLEPSLEPAGAIAPEASPRKERARRSPPAADKIVKAWWETRDPKPLQQFLAIRGIVGKALNAGWGEEEVAAALDRVGGDPPLVAWKLEKALTAARSTGPPGDEETYPAAAPIGAAWENPETQPMPWGDARGE